MLSTEVIEELLSQTSVVSTKGQSDDTRKQAIEAVLGTSIIEAMSKSGRYRSADKSIYVFDGKRYLRMEEAELESLVYTLIERSGASPVYLISTPGKVAKMLTSSIRIPQFRPTRRYVSFENCVLDLDTDKVSSFSSDFETRISIPVEYDPTAKCPTWDSFLLDVIGDVNSIRVLQEFLGLAFVDRTIFKVEVVMFLYGTGSNGKGVVYEMIKSIFGENCSSMDLYQLCAHPQSDYYTAEVNGKLLNFCSDMGDKDFSGGRFKQIASGEPLTVRPIGRAPFEVRELPLLISSINKIPTTTDSSDGYWRRNKIISFPKTIAEEDQDRTLSDRIKKEKSGVLNWILEGRRRIISTKGQFTECSRIAFTVQQARIDSSSVLSWLQDMGYSSTFRRGKLYREIPCFTKDMFRSYQDWCSQNGCVAKSRKNFMGDIRQAGFAYEERMRVAGEVSSGFRVYVLQGDDPNYSPVVIDEDQEAVEDLPF